LEQLFVRIEHALVHIDHSIVKIKHLAGHPEAQTYFNLNNVKALATKKNEAGDLLCSMYPLPSP
jgi:hypothetical protein